MEGYIFRNWAETFFCKPERYYEPQNISELTLLVHMARKEGKRVKVCGSRHSPSDIACTTGYMINMKHINKVISVDVDKCQIHVEAGVKLEKLNIDILPRHGLALSVLGAISEQTIAGAISTGTHGTGYNHGIMATNIVSLELLTGRGEVLQCSASENPDVFSAACCGLGALGIILTVTIQCEPAYRLHEIQTSTTLDDVLDNLDSYVEGSEHFRFLWYPHTDMVVISKLNRTERSISTTPPSWFWNKLIGYHAMEFSLWLSEFYQPLVPWINWLYFLIFSSQPKERVDIGHRVFNFDCLFKQLVTEWNVPRNKTGEVLRELRDNIDKRRFYAHMPTEVRFTRSDDIMISPANGRETCFINIIHFRPYGRKTLNTKYWAVYEDILKRAGGRPHWAKEHPLRNKELSELYPRWTEFCDLRKKLDPHGMFLNAYLERILSD
nr:L-gulonolactone oxidase-like [Lytechinus pictus]